MLVVCEFDDHPPIKNAATYWSCSLVLQTLPRNKGDDLAQALLRPIRSDEAMGVTQEANCGGRCDALPVLRVLEGCLGLTMGECRSVLSVENITEIALRRFSFGRRGAVDSKRVCFIFHRMIICYSFFLNNSLIVALQPIFHSE